MPLVKYTTVSGEHYALLDTGCDNTITYITRPDNINDTVEIVGFGGNKKDTAAKGELMFEMQDENNGSMTFSCNAILVSPDFFKPIWDNGLCDVEMILGMNFLTKYQAKIDLKNKMLMLK